MIEPLHVIILGIAIVMAGAIWQWRQAPMPDPRIAQLESQVNDLTKKLTFDHKSAAIAAPPAQTPPKITTAPADIPKKLAAIDSLRKILNEEMLSWINSGQQLSTGGWWNWYVGDQVPHMQEVARNFFTKSDELDREIHRIHDENAQFPDIQALSSSPLGRPFLLKIQNLVTPILALPSDPSKKMESDLYRFLFEPYAKETYAALNDVQDWRGSTERNALELRKQLSQ